MGDLNEARILIVDDEITNVRLLDRLLKQAGFHNIMTTTDPGDEFGGSARLGAGSDSLIDGFLAVDAPFSERFKSRFIVSAANPTLTLSRYATK